MPDLEEVKKRIPRKKKFPAALNDHVKLVVEIVQDLYKCGVNVSVRAIEGNKEYAILRSSLKYKGVIWSRVLKAAKIDLPYYMFLIKALLKECPGGSICMVKLKTFLETIKGLTTVNPWKIARTLESDGYVTLPKRTLYFTKDMWKLFPEEVIIGRNSKPIR